MGELFASLVGGALKLKGMWDAGNDEERANAEAKARASLIAMGEVGAQTLAAHDARVAALNAALTTQPEWTVIRMPPGEPKP